MSEPDPEFIVVGPGEVDFGVLPAPFRLEGARSSAEQRTWLDTADWRLHQAGAVLTRVETADRTALELALEDGRRPTLLLDATVTWPTLADALPAGDLRTALEPVVGVRALLAVVTVRSTLRRMNVVNADDKSVARIVLQDGTVPGVGPLPTRLRLSPVRGYQGPTDRVAGAFRSATGLRNATESAYAAAVAVVGRRFGDDVVEPAPLRASMPADEAVLDVLQVYRRTVETNWAGVVDDIDTEFLHDLRVAVRRARSTVKLTGDVLDPEQSERLGNELKWLGDLTSPTRDLDVYLLGLPARLSSASLGDLRPFRAYLRRQRRAEWRRLVRGLRSARYAELMDRWVRLSTQDGETVVQSAGTLAAERIARAHKKVLKRGRAIAPESPADDLHDVRKRCKELRYLLEMFRPIHPKTAHREILRSLKALQECLGDLQDGEVQGVAVRRFATRMLDSGTASAETVLAMGGLAAQLTEQQLAARERFSQTFADFAGKATRRHFATLSTVDTR